MTPEGKVKKMIKDRLRAYGEDVYSHWPVLNGMGSPELDCNLIVNGYAVSIEAKAPGERMTTRQRLTAKAKRAGGIEAAEGRQKAGIRIPDVIGEYLVGNEPKAVAFAEGVQR